MAKYIKPDYSEQWASAGDKVTPDSVKIQTGHIVEKPNYEYMNWLQNRQDTAIAYSLQMGVVEWDNTTQYQYTLNSHASYVQRNGVVYKAIQTGINKDPLTETAYWSIAFDDKGSAATVQANLNTHINNYGTLTGLTNTTTARTNLDVYSKAEAAQKNGDSTKLFSVADGTVGNEAVNFQQLVTKADKNGNSAEVFSVATPTLAAHAVRNDQLLAYLPSGVVVSFAGTAIPTGWLECNGAAVSRTTYSLLFATIGTLYGIGDGSTTFNLPDLRGEFVRGYDNGRNVDTGRVIGSNQADLLGSHTHGYPEVEFFSGDAQASNGARLSGNTVQTASTGGTETRPRNVAMYYIIRT